MKKKIGIYAGDGYSLTDDRISKAVTSALSARFEHGESPKI
jgi:hypothetical protein